MHDHRDHEGADKLYELIKGTRICMMTTVEPDGTLHSRPMYGMDADEAGDLWFFTKISSPKVTEISKDGQVNLAYANPEKQDYVSVSGRAEIVRDRARIDEKWSPAARAWFPDGKDDPQIALIRVHPERGEYWDSPSATIVNIYGYAKAMLTGSSPMELSDTQKVDLR
jgi:general stress protein 26